MLPLRPVELTGPHLTLLPLRPEHYEGLLAVAADPAVFTWLPVRRPTTTDELAAWLVEAYADVPTRLPFAVLDSDETVLGTTAYWDSDPAAGRVEIGATWLRRSSWGTSVNAEAKWLLLGHAFDALGCGHVVLRTDERNLRSRRAIEKLGARFDRAVERDLQRRDGTWRTSRYYRIDTADWNTLRAALEHRLLHEHGSCNSDNA